ncbi:hypothetical protein AX16_008545 [Volvariella volvacea WC 439]|nr:hypothetical protein AX16_008545 [Volvariella volvacea WC 439]
MTAPFRGFKQRRSFDGTISMPALPSTEPDSPALSQSWIQHLQARLRPPDISPERSTGNDPIHRVSFAEVTQSLPTTTPGSRISVVHDAALRAAAARSIRADYQLHYRGNSERDRSRPPKPPSSSSRPSQNNHTRSPRQLLHDLSVSTGLHRHEVPSRFEEPFIPIDPFEIRAHFQFTYWGFTIRRQPSPDPEIGVSPPSSDSSQSSRMQCEDVIPQNTMANFRLFLTETLPRLMYLNFLLWLPAMYFSRVARIFEDAEVSKPDIQRMIESRGGGGGSYLIPSAADAAAAALNRSTAHAMSHPLRVTGDASPRHGIATGLGVASQVAAAPLAGSSLGVPAPLPSPEDWTPAYVSPALIRFKHSWEAFIDSLLREWKTLNLVSALLLSAILTMFQVPSAAEDPLTRTPALMSLVCATMSLSYGCMYILRFGTMRSMIRASRWAEEAGKNKTAVLWNVWVFLAMPGVWMSWAMILFVISIFSFVWRTGSTADPEVRPPLPPSGALGTRIAITAIFALGLIYLFLILRTLKRYGHVGARRPSRIIGGKSAISMNNRFEEANTDRVTHADGTVRSIADDGRDAVKEKRDVSVATRGMESLTGLPPRSVQNTPFSSVQRGRTRARRPIGVMTSVSPVRGLELEGVPPPKPNSMVVLDLEKDEGGGLRGFS